LGLLVILLIHLLETHLWEPREVKIKITLYRFLTVGLLAVMCLARGLTGVAQVPAAHKTQNVILVMMDGLRWQEVFRGADPELIKIQGPDWLGAQKVRTAQAQQDYWRETPEERRQALMPFLWSTIASQGQIFGNRDLGSESQVTNGLNFSYPGYNETLTGFADPRIHSNDNVPNPNVTVFEWLNAKPAFAGKVAAFGAWNVYNGIFNKERCGFVVNAFSRAKPMLYSVCVRVPAAIPERPRRRAATTLGGAPSHSTNVRQSPLSASTTEFARAKSASSTKTANRWAFWPPFEALRIARERGLDLVEVSPNAVPRLPHSGLRPLPLREGQERTRRPQETESDRRQGGQVLSDRGRARLPDQEESGRALPHRDGDKVKASLRFRGRQMAHRELGYAIINKLIQDIGEAGIVEFMPRMEGTILHAIWRRPRSRKQPKPKLPAPPQTQAAAPLRGCSKTSSEDVLDRCT
jgi:hypothetical protein